ncbi:hypothetical protein B0H19DRAFT_149449 [Mycena capillaripes]|nr:hypothetical protein B0H19DRAFT_149449 [Mycena capillaripes]
MMVRTVGDWASENIPGLKPRAQGVQGVQGVQQLPKLTVGVNDGVKGQEQHKAYNHARALVTPVTPFVLHVIQSSRVAFSGKIFLASGGQFTAIPVRVFERIARYRLESRADLQHSPCLWIRTAQGLSLDQCRARTVMNVRQFLLEARSSHYYLASNASLIWVNIGTSRINRTSRPLTKYSTSFSKPFNELARSLLHLLELVLPAIALLAQNRAPRRHPDAIHRNIDPTLGSHEIDDDHAAQELNEARAYFV